MNPTRLIGEWGADHWPLLAYIQTVMADCGEFEVGFDPHMRHNNLHLDIMCDRFLEDPKYRGPKRSGNKTNFEHASSHSAIDYSMSSKFRDGSIDENSDHDDWNCVQDMIKEGLFREKSMDKDAPLSIKQFDVGTCLQFTEKGMCLVEALLRHKYDGGNFKGFKCPEEFTGHGASS